MSVGETLKNCGHIGKAGCAGRKEMVSGACVSNGRGGNHRLGQGINWWGCNGFS